MRGDNIREGSDAEPKSDWRQLRAMTDEEVHAAALADPEIRRTDEDFWRTARLVHPQPRYS